MINLIIITCIYIKIIICTSGNQVSARLQLFFYQLDNSFTSEGDLIPPYTEISNAVVVQEHDSNNSLSVTFNISAEPTFDPAIKHCLMIRYPDPDSYTQFADIFSIFAKDEDNLPMAIISASYDEGFGLYFESETVFTNQEFIIDFQTQATSMSAALNLTTYYPSYDIYLKSIMFTDPNSPVETNTYISFVVEPDTLHFTSYSNPDAWIGVGRLGSSSGTSNSTSTVTGIENNTDSMSLEDIQKRIEFSKKLPVITAHESNQIYHMSTLMCARKQLKSQYNPNKYGYCRNRNIKEIILKYCAFVTNTISALPTLTSRSTILEDTKKKCEAADNPMNLYCALLAKIVNKKPNILCRSTKAIYGQVTGCNRYCDGIVHDVTYELSKNDCKYYNGIYKCCNICDKKIIDNGDSIFICHCEKVLNDSVTTDIELSTINSFSETISSDLDIISEINPDDKARNTSKKRIVFFIGITVLVCGCIGAFVYLV